MKLSKLYFYKKSDKMQFLQVYAQHRSVMYISEKLEIMFLLTLILGVLKCIILPRI